MWLFCLKLFKTLFFIFYFSSFLAFFQIFLILLLFIYKNSNKQFIIFVTDVALPHTAPSSLSAHKTCEHKLSILQYFDWPPPSKYHHKLRCTNSGSTTGFECILCYTTHTDRLPRGATYTYTSLQQSVQQCSRSQPATYSKDKGRFFSENTRLETWSWQLTTIRCRGYESEELYIHATGLHDCTETLPLLYTLQWRVSPSCNEPFLAEPLRSGFDCTHITCDVQQCQYYLREFVLIYIAVNRDRLKGQL
jgi:hypothetical protein